MHVKQESNAWEFWYWNFELSIICNSGETKCPTLRGWYNEAFYYICGSFDSQRSHFLGILNRMNVLGHFCTAVAKYPIPSNKWEIEAHALTAPEDKSTKDKYMVFVTFPEGKTHWILTWQRHEERKKKRQEFSCDFNFSQLSYTKRRALQKGESKISNHSNDKCYILPYIIAYHSILRKVMCWLF